MTRFTTLACSLLFLALTIVATTVVDADESANKSRATTDEGHTIRWLDDYSEAVQQAKSEGKLLLIHFADSRQQKVLARLQRELDKPANREPLSQYVLLRLPVDARVKEKGRKVTLLNHPSMVEMERCQGIVIVDHANEGTEHFGHVVSSWPCKSGKYYRYDPRHLSVLLDLPVGSATQRTIVFAVRIHPEAPASTKGKLDPNLMWEARQHSQYQAQIGVQGHHHWDRRFHRIARLLPFGLRAQEVVAESWPQESMLDAAVDCVASWRQSSGHWGAVKSPQPRFAYDMRRGSNGIWYATGIFGNRG